MGLERHWCTPSYPRTDETFMQAHGCGVVAMPRVGWWQGGHRVFIRLLIQFRLGGTRHTAKPGPELSPVLCRFSPQGLIELHCFVGRDASLVLGGLCPKPEEDVPLERAGLLLRLTACVGMHGRLSGSKEDCGGPSRRQPPAASR